MQAEPHDWECSACEEEYTTDINILTSLPWYDPDGFLTCAECIKSRFQRALTSGIVWPARWGTTFLNPRHYRQILGDKLYDAYTAKEQAKALEPLPNTPVIPDGLTRGVDVQICPNPRCKKLIGLRDGCNHIICEACTQNFCLICGHEAHDGSNHWVSGGCPRFGPRGAPRAIHDPQPNEADNAPPFRVDTVIIHWNVAMQTSSLKTQSLLRRFRDGGGPAIPAESRMAATLALGIYNPLSGVSEADWHAPEATANRIIHDLQLLGMLQVVRETEMVVFNPAPPGDENHIYADTGPLRNVLRGPIARVFDMSTRLPRDDAYNWIATTLHIQPDDRVFGVLTQEDSAILSGITQGQAEIVESFLQLMNRRPRAVQFTPTSVLLTVRGDFFGPMVPFVGPFDPTLGFPEHFAESAEVSGGCSTLMCGTSHTIGFETTRQGRRARG